MKNSVQNVQVGDCNAWDEEMTVRNLRVEEIGKRLDDWVTTLKVRSDCLKKEEV